MAQIHVLDSETIDKIAAGEVVERPSSVVKELVENAIDAGADAITVEAKDGGIEFIRVTDNGCGMEREQLRNAFLRHATSKIEDVKDLTRLSSLGFRGEALSSIAAVSRVEVVTKTPESMTGTRILLEGAREVEFDEVGAPEGTTFLMRNLFFNTPVRRKFLKQPATEGGYIVDLMEHLALSRPDISFKLVMGGQLKFHTSGNGDLKEVIYRIYGRDVVNSLLPIQTAKDGIRIEGYLGKPVLVRSNRNFEIYFINGRFIRSSLVSKALEEGYKEYLMQHKFPFCVLHITMDTEQVDVNVHPTKMDVRFSDSILFSGCLMEMVSQALRQKEMIPEAQLCKEEKAECPKKQKSTPEPFERARTQTYRLMEEAKYEAERASLDFSRNPVWSRVKNQETGQAQEDQEAGRMSKPEVFFADEDLTEKILTEEDSAKEDLTEKNITEEDLAEEEKTELEDSGSHEMEFCEELPEPSKQLNLFEEKILSADSRSRFRMIGQVFETYWLIEFEDKLLFIDQHAAHEKVNYERLMKRYHNKTILSQGLLPPVIVSLSGQEENVLKDNLDAFAALGFEIEAFGGSEYALRSVPVDLYGCDERGMFLEVLDRLSDGTGFGSIRVVEEKIASMSCKAAVKGNSHLSFAEAESLIDELLTLENPYNCPHGRPTIITMSRSEMDRKFKRIVT